MNGFTIGLECIACAHLQDDRAAAFRCERCGGFTEIRYDLDAARRQLSRESIGARRGGLWRYRELMPLRDDRSIVTLGEGGTPLLASRRVGPALGLDRLYFKDLARNPTGSFKDYSASVSVSKAREIGIRSIVLTSAGNASSAFAAYSSLAGIAFHALMLPNSYAGMVAQNMIYGAHGYIVRGNSADGGRLAGRLERERGWMNAGVPLNPYRAEGKRAIGFEIAEDLGWRSPDRIVCPTAGGTSILALWKAFNEMRALGWVDAIPRLDCVQSVTCAPVVTAWRQKGPIRAAERPDSIAIGLLAPDPAAGPKLLEIIGATGGHGETVSDDEIRAAQRALAREEGLYVEPSSAAALAGLARMARAGTVRREETIVLMLTGSGLKSTEAIAATLPAPIEIDPDGAFPD